MGDESVAALKNSMDTGIATSIGDAMSNLLNLDPDKTTSSTTTPVKDGTTKKTSSNSRTVAAAEGFSTAAAVRSP